MRGVDIDDLLDDPELERLHSERLAALQKEAEKRVVLERKGHGEYQELQEGEFIEAVTTADRCVCHFFHRSAAIARHPVIYHRSNEYMHWPFHKTEHHLR